MKKWIPQFWYSPIKRHRIAVISSLLLVVSMGSLLFIDIHSHIYISWILAIFIVICSILISTFYTFGQLKEILHDVSSFLKTSERNAIYDYYQLKHQDKDYKGPLWEDEEFKKIPDLKERVDAFVKTSIEYQEVDFKRWKKRNVGINLDTRSQTIFRSFWILCATAISIISLSYLGWFEYLSADNLKNLSDTSRGFFTIPIALIGSIVAAPIIFIVWLFRDKNNRVQIENARKDTNLKDFQKLSEWASGFHLPEIKKNTGSKITIKTIDNIREIVEETTNSIEDFIVHESSNSISRRQGAEALQASAIAQLEAFMFGKYGEQFMQPAFLLIHAIWESAITQQQINHPHISDFNKALNQLHKNPIISALNRALVGENGYHLRLFESSLKNINLSGLMVNRSDNSKKLNLIGLTLTEVDLSHAALDNTQMQGATLKNSNFDSTSLTDTDLHGADLRYCEFNYTIFEQAKLRYTNLEGCMLQGVTLRSATLEYANFQSSSIVDCNFKNANLKGANLKGALLDNNNFKNALINRFTLFGEYDGLIDQYINENEIREDILSKYAIWDDDPIWLTDKFNDKILLNNVIKRSKDFASGYVFF